MLHRTPVTRARAVLPIILLLLTGRLPAAEDDSIEARFRRFDRDGNDAITPDELSNTDLFKRLDFNGDGKVTRDEAKQVLAKQGAPAKPTVAPTTSANEFVEDDLKPLAEPLRDLDPVVVTGESLRQLLGQPPEQIVAFKYFNGWTQIPLQIDERCEVDLGRIRGGAGQPEFKVLVYADAAMRTGADPDSTFDADDELALMFHDVGERAGADDPSGVVTGSRVELQIIDEIDSRQTPRFAYLFVTDGALQPAVGQDYVQYKFRLLKGNISGNGPNPEDSVVLTSRYRNHFSDRWVHDGTQITVGDANGVNILDRDEFQFKPGVCNRTTDTFSRGAGAFITNRDGPIRAIRSVSGCNSGTYTQRDYFFYAGRMTVRTYFRVHPIGATWSFYDFNSAAASMTYYDNLNLTGVTVDGSPDDVKTDGVMHWQLLTGRQGSLTMAWKVTTDIPGLRRFAYYFDDKAADACPCSGDRIPIAACGPATGELPNTDPVLRTRTTVHHLQTDRIVFYDPPGVTISQAQARVTAAWFPLRVENTSEAKP